MDVSICIVSWNTKDMLYNCIKSIKEKTVGLSYEIIIVDNASWDGTSEMVRVHFPECKFIESNDNLGFAKGNNVAAKAALGRYILFLNPDTELLTNAVYGMYSHLEKCRDIGAIGCKLVDPRGEVQYTCASTYPNASREISSSLLLNRFFPKSAIFTSRELNYWDHQDSRYVDCLSGACIMVRRKIISQIGGFDEKIFMYAEDLDLCYRILKKGWNVFYLSKEVILHHEGASSDKKGKHFAVLLQKHSDLYFIQKHFGPKKAIEYRVAILLGALFRMFIIICSYPIYKPNNSPKLKSIRHRFSKYIVIIQWALGFFSINQLKNL